MSTYQRSIKQKQYIRMNNKNILSGNLLKNLSQIIIQLQKTKIKQKRKPCPKNQLLKKQWKRKCLLQKRKSLKLAQKKKTKGFQMQISLMYKNFFRFFQTEKTLNPSRRKTIYLQNRRMQQIFLRQIKAQVT